MYVIEYAICLCYLCVFFFFFKQKTAYEMRISDWSSDVCSSDLAWAMRSCAECSTLRVTPTMRSWHARRARCVRASMSRRRMWAACANARSEEHTSELQSLMRISYAVFCLKKKIVILVSYCLQTTLTYLLSQD